MSNATPLKPSPFGSHATLVTQLEQEIAALRVELTKTQRAGARLEGVKEYVFRDMTGGVVSLAQLFGKHDDLLVIHNMGERCIYCGLWADGLSAFAPHFERRVALVLATPDAVESAKRQVALRGWTMRVVSDAGSPFANEMGFEGTVDERGRIRMPGVSAFRRTADGRIDRISAATFGPGDPFCGAWPLLDLLEGGVGDFKPLARTAATTPA